MEVGIRVETDAMLDEASRIALDISRMEELIQQMNEIVRRTGSYWRGEASDLYRNSYLEQEEARQEIWRSLEDDPKKLSEISKIFRDASVTAVQTVEGLPSDICGGDGSSYCRGAGWQR